jgi:hypothetical protein
VQPGRRFSDSVSRSNGSDSPRADQSEVMGAGRIFVFGFERSTPSGLAASSEMTTNLSQKSPRSTTNGISAKSRSPI